MGGGGGACTLCTPLRSRKRRHGRPGRDSPVQWCTRCHAHVCAKHSRWNGDKYLCTRCYKVNPHTDQDGG